LQLSQLARLEHLCQCHKLMKYIPSAKCLFAGKNPVGSKE
jgi:hypothetical protein